MQLKELPSFLEIDIKSSLEDRFMESEALYVRFLKKLLNDTNVVELKQAVDAEDWENAMRKAHNLKGVCANLGLTKLSRDFAAIVAELRSDAYTAQSVGSLLEKALIEWEKTINYIRQLD